MPHPWAKKKKGKRKQNKIKKKKATKQTNRTAEKKEKKNEKKENTKLFYRYKHGGRHTYSYISEGENRGSCI